MMNIIQKRKYTYIFSLVLIMASIAALSIWGLRLGIDFQGGTLLEVRYPENTPTSDEIQQSLQDQNLSSLTVQPTDNNGILLRYLESDETVNEQVTQALTDLREQATIVRVDFIGASVSQELIRKAIEAIIVAIIAIAGYVAWAFRKVSFPVPSWQYGIAAVLALAHDAIIVLGIFAVLGRYMDIEVGIPFVAAILTIVGYSVNDTIVVFDRTRENLLRHRSKKGFEEIVNLSLNSTIARSINTSLTVVIVLMAIILFGGMTVQAFSIALLAGVIAGTYSSIYVASALLVTSYGIMQKHKQ